MADRYFINGGTDNNWGSTANWSATSGGTGGASIPTAADAVFFDANSPNVTVNFSNRACLSLNFTGYTNTITMTFNITVSGSVTLVAAMGIAGTGSLIVNATATLTSNGRTWPNALSLASSVTYTFADNWVVSGLVTIGGSTSGTFNANQITCNGGLTGTATATTTGTTKFVLGGGTVTMNLTTGITALSFDYAGDITFASGSNFRINGGTHTYVSGTVTFAGTHTLAVFGTSCTFNTTSSIVWKNISISGTALTVTLTTPLYLDGILTIGTSLSSVTINGTIYAAGDFVYNTTNTLALLGTGEIIMNGTGTIDQGSGTSIPSFPLIIDTTGNITITSVSRWDLGKFVVRNAGSITTTEAWDLGGGGTFNPLQHPLIR